MIHHQNASLPFRHHSRLRHSGTHRFLWALAASLCALATSGICLAQTTPQSVHERIIDLTSMSAVDPVRVQVGDILELRVSGNASTGYAWRYVDAGKGFVENLGRHRIEHAMKEGRPVVGSSSLQTWRLRAVALGCQVVRFEYARPWETEKAPSQVASYRILVGDGDDAVAAVPDQACD